jgi:predicted MPP superfamily phosphohydrolase
MQRAYLLGENMTYLIILIILIILIAIDSNRFVVREYTVTSDKITRDEDILLLADLHGKRYGESNRRLLKRINKLKFDRIYTVGDMLNAPSTLDNFDTSVEFMRAMASYGKVYYSLGNHEYRAKNNTDAYGILFDAYETIMNAFGIKLMDNEKASFENTDVYALSISKMYYNRGKRLPMEKEDVSNLIGEPDPSKFNILLAHNPEYFDAYASWGADLVLSGHMHGGVIRLFKGMISSRFTLFPKYDGGYFKKNNAQMVVSRGLGAHTIPFRLFNPAEIVLIHLKSVER